MRSVIFGKLPRFLPIETVVIGRVPVRWDARVWSHAPVYMVLHEDFFGPGSHKGSVMAVAAKVRQQMCGDYIRELVTVEGDPAVRSPPKKLAYLLEAVYKLKELVPKVGDGVRTAGRRELVSAGSRRKRPTPSCRFLFRPAPAPWASITIGGMMWRDKHSWMVLG